MSKNKLYTFVLVACLLGFLYLIYSINYSESSHLKFCIFKNVTGYPCPSCGTTRAVQLFLRGNFVASLQMNPFGILVSILMVILPVWIVYDFITHKNTFYTNYKKVETILKTRWLAIALIILVILNWIWNIKKGL
jgi:hypothetical protein